jgi:type III secretion system YscJ/HrcJ family lipoprotein
LPGCHVQRRRAQRGATELPILVLALASISCTAPVAHDLEDGTANRMTLALQRAGTLSSKEPDPDNQGKWTLTVAKSEVSRALEVLAREGLPEERRRLGLSEVSGQNSLLPSLQLEQARLLAGISNDLERSLASIEGIAAAKVHLGFPRWDPLSQTSELVPGASVLIKYRGGSCPIAVEDVKRIVSGAVTTKTDSVQVVTIPSPETRDNSPNIVLFGPFAVLRETAALLRLAVGVSVALNLSTLALLIYFWQKTRKGSAG